LFPAIPTHQTCPPYKKGKQGWWHSCHMGATKPPPMRSLNVLPTFPINQCHRLSGIFQIPSIELTKVSLFVCSLCIFVVQAHLLFPLPLSRRRSPLPFTSPARFVDWLIHYVLKNCFPHDANIMQDCSNPALLEHVARSRVDPHVMQSLLWLVFLSHTVCWMNKKPLQLCQCSC
jgi:hypothetical protein